MNIEIKKAKLKNGLELEYRQYPGEGEMMDVKCSNSGEPHKDLKDLFAELTKHLPLLCEDIDIIEVGDIEQWQDARLIKYGVRSYTRGGEDEFSGVVISGYKTLKSGKVVNLNSPFTRWEDENDEYKFIRDLQSTIEEIELEIEKYLFKGKRAPSAQLELDFEQKEAVA